MIGPIDRQFDDEPGGGFIDMVTPGGFTQQAHENLQERRENPRHWAMNTLSQGATGPGPAFVTNEEGDVQIEHPQGFEQLNRESMEAFGLDPDVFDEFNRKSDEADEKPSDLVRKVLYIAGAFVLLHTVGQLITFEVGV